MSISKKFDIYDQSSWRAASNQKFKWGQYTFINDSTGEHYTEREIADFFSSVFSQMDHAPSLIERRWVINSTLQGYVDKASRPELLSKTYQFDILNPDTWGFASKDRQFVWDGVPLFKADGSPMSEHDAADFFEATFAFLERDGDTVPLEKKQHGIRTVLDRMETYNTKEAIDRKLKEEREDEACKGKIKVPIRCNYIREKKAFDGRCWKCGSSILREFEDRYQCPSCGFLTFHIGDRYLDEWEYHDLDESRVFCSSAHGFVYFLRDRLGDDYARIERSCAGLPEFSKINIAFSVLIDTITLSSKIDYQDLHQAYSEYSRFLFEHGAYFYEALYNASICDLMDMKESRSEKVRAVCRFPCVRKCDLPGPMIIDEAMSNPVIPKRDALDTGYHCYDDLEDAEDDIASGRVIGYCHAAWEQCFEQIAGNKTTLLDAAMAKMRGRQEAWGAAVAKARAEFEAQGVKDPDDRTPGYRERINELFRGLYSKSSLNDGGKWAEDWFRDNPKHQ